ncbi:MAG: hypothetical protein CMC76_03195 [Flavobacteriaceae bacterium]|uniref:DUF4260 domain-containing protein n=1 Tax=Winogradskyella sp. SYSU M77433 TaxID=3042722 RepID=UPI000C4EBD70|nr:DUF4260 domain-containing protein [Winogradskyella sp. SYSU M77433]MAX70095.1 hypothetical protein [Flavobacteriaceae bacterium]MDH7912054.1 DUF4260 domain-containing protein [Winogradskyella sp. SYSU M77433]
MKTTLKLEELGMFILGIFLFNQLSYAWWWFLALILLPDIGMLGYLVSTKIGALTYNIFHHKGLAIATYFVGIYFEIELLQLVGVVLFSHASLDRIFGYGLKYKDNFKSTHLGQIGNN